MSRAYTPEEVRHKILTHLHALSEYWSRQPGKNRKEMCDGLVFSVLTMLDGATLQLPSFDLIPSPHPDDKQYHIDNGENWFEPEVVNDVQLHEFWHNWTAEAVKP